MVGSTPQESRGLTATAEGPSSGARRDSSGAVTAGTAPTADTVQAPSLAPSASSPSNSSPSASSRSGTKAPAAGDTPAASPVPGPVAPPAPVERSPGAATRVVIASVGTYTGPVGTVFTPGMETVRAWVRHINDLGGLNGHEVRFVVYDDGGDPARHRSQVQEAVETQHVIAFVYNAEVISGAGSTEYVTRKRIPVIGSEGASPWFYDHPTYFPQSTVGDLVLLASVHSAAQLAIPAGYRKLATVTCEIENCRRTDRIWGDTAPKVGFEHVYRGTASLVQPDYTAECLAARNAGAQVFFVGLDTNSVGRLAASCARQGYRPRYTTVAPIPVDRMKNDPNLNGLTASSSVFPYFQKDTPATDEYQQVMQSYGSKIAKGTSSAFGWVAAKLFQRAATGLPDPPTSESILRGLWTLRGDNLGGLTLPLTFTQDQNPPQRTCWFNIQIADGTWRSPDQNQAHCLAA